MYLVLTLSVLLFVYALYAWHRRNVCGHKLPPALPGALPIVGHNHKFLRNKNNFAEFIEDLIKFADKSGGVICFYFADQIYYGDTYHSHRKLLNPAFSLSVAYGFLDVFNDESRRLTDIFDGFVGQGPVDTSECFRNSNLRTSCRTILGAHDEKNNDFLNTYTVAINSIFATIMDRMLTVRLHSDFFFRFSSLKKKQDELIELINGMLQMAIERSKDKMKKTANIVNLSESDPGFRSFIDIMLEIAADGSLSDQEIKNELNTAAAASYETTSRQLVIVMVLLGTYPDIQEKVFQEIMEVVGERDLEKENIPKLVYTEAFIKECMRVVTVVSLLPRYVDRDLKLKNYTLRAGTNVFLCAGGIHKQPAWGHDLNEFRPERWLEKGKQLDNMLYAFGFGQRVCLGKKFAMVSMKVTVAHIVRKFRIKGDVNKMKFKFELIMRPESGHEITLERRNLT